MDKKTSMLDAFRIADDTLRQGIQGVTDLITIPGCHCHVLDPSNDPAFDPTIREHGIACKAIFDCTVPFDLKKNFIRSQFMEIDKDKWAKEIAF